MYCGSGGEKSGEVGEVRKRVMMGCESDSGEESVQEVICESGERCKEGSKRRDKGK